MNDLEKIKEKRLKELKEAAIREDFIQQQLEGVKKTILQRYLTKAARERLASLRAGHPQLAEQVELNIVEAARAGGLVEQIDEEKLKNILEKINATKKKFRILR